MKYGLSKKVRGQKDDAISSEPNRLKHIILCHQDSCIF